MGNAALRELAHLESVSFDSLSGQVVAIDAHNWLYRYLTTTVRFTNSASYTTAEGEEVANLIGILQGVAKLVEGSITPIFVFDGTPSTLKADEIKRRKEARDAREVDLAAARDRGDFTEVARLESQTQRLTDTIQQTSRVLLSHLDIAVVEAPAAGEAQAAHMTKRGLADAAGSEDYDTMLFGAARTLRGLTSSGKVERLDLDATLESNGLTLEQLIDVAILIGTDYNEGLRGFGPKTAVTAIKDHGDLWSVLDVEGRAIEGADRVRDLYLDPPVVEVDLEPSFPKPSIDAVREYVTAEWEIDPTAVERSIDRIKQATQQTGLDHFG